MGSLWWWEIHYLLLKEILKIRWQKYPCDRAVEVSLCLALVRLDFAALNLRLLAARNWLAQGWAEKINKTGEGTRKQDFQRKLCCCSVWRREGIPTLSITLWKEVLLKRVLTSFLRWQATGCEGTIPSCARGCLDWIIDKGTRHWNSLPRWVGCPHSWGILRVVWTKGHDLVVGLRLGW